MSRNRKPDWSPAKFRLLAKRVSKDTSSYVGAESRPARKYSKSDYERFSDSDTQQHTVTS